MYQQNNGYTLLEFLLAMVLLSLLTSTLLVVYWSQSKSYIIQNALIQIQQSAHFVLFFLNRSLRLAGDDSCLVDSKINSLNNTLIGFQNVTSPMVPDELQNQVRADTDFIVITRCENMQFIKLAYFIGDTHRRNQNGQIIYALYEKPLPGERTELIAGVDNMKIKYGLRLMDEEDIFQYLSAADVTNWKNIKSVQIDLLFNSIEPVLTGTQTYSFNGKTYHISDRLLRRTWNTYISLRERE